MLIGCAVFHDVLKPCAQLCNVLQDDDACIVEAVLKTKKSIENLKSTTLENLTSVKKVNQEK